MTPVRKLPVISGDDHLEIDSKMWVHRVPKEYVDQAPRRIVLEDGREAWQAGDSEISVHPKGAYGARSDWTPLNSNRELTPGSGTPEQRMSELDRDGVDASLLFFGGSGPGGIRKIKDQKAYLAVVRAYNEFLALDYCAVNPKRLMGAAYVPMSNVDDATAELENMKEIGNSVALLSRFPNGSGIPKKEDDKFWAAAVDLQMPISFHSQIPIDSKLYIEYPNVKPELLEPLTEATEYVRELGYASRLGGINALQLIISGVFDRFPTLRIFGAETGIGWLPWMIENADHRYERHHKWAEELLGVTPLKHGLPSEYIKRHFVWGFQADTVGIAFREMLGVENLIWASDFPHLESDWPYSIQQLEKNFADVDQQDFEKMTCLNIVNFLGIQDRWASELSQAS